MAFELIKISEFPQVSEPGDWIVVSDAAGTGYKISKEDFKEWLGTVTVITDKPIALADPAPTLDGVYLPTEPGTYTNAGGLVYDPEGVDAGKYVQFIKDDTAWTKLALDLPQAENKIPGWEAGTYAQGDQRIHNGQIWSVDVPSTTEEPGVGSDWTNDIQVGGEGIKDLAVDPLKTTFAKYGKNLFNKNTVTPNTILDYPSQTEIESATYDTSALFRVEPSTYYNRSHLSPVFFYDSDGIIVGSYPANTTPVQSPANAVYAKISVRKTDKDEYQFEKGQEKTDYEPWGKVLIPDLVLPDSVVNPVITPEKTTFVRRSKNLFNKNDVTSSTILSDTTGEESANASWDTSKFFSVKPSTEYKRSGNSILCFYNINEVFIEGHPANTIPVTSPSNAAFAKVSVLKSQNSTYQLEEGEVTTDYEAFDSSFPDGLVITEDSLSTEYKSQQEAKITAAQTAADSALMATVSSRMMPEGVKYPAEIVRLLDGVTDVDRYTVNESPATVSMLRDKANYWVDGSEGYNLSISEAGTARLVAEPNTPIDIPISSVVGLAIFVPDPTALSNFVTELYMNSELDPVWTRDYTTPLKQGWNIIRHHVIPKRAGYGLGILDPWGTQVHRIRLMPVFTKASNVTIGAMWLESSPKAQLLFVDDGGYDTFLGIGYPQLKARGIPTTWALNPGILGTGVRISEADVDLLTNDVESAFSFHSWASDPAENMTPKEIREDVTRCVRWLRRKGLVENSIWRAAVVQNKANNEFAQRGLVDASRTYNEDYGFDAFPFIDRWNIPRNQLHGGTNLADFFELMKRTNSLAVVYTHGIIEGSIYDVTPARWNEFIGHLDTALSEGWLEGVTYESLNHKMEPEHNTYYLEALKKTSRS